MTNFFIFTHNQPTNNGFHRHYHGLCECIKYYCLSERVWLRACGIGHWVSRRQAKPVSLLAWLAFFFPFLPRRCVPSAALLHPGWEHTDRAKYWLTYCASVKCPHMDLELAHGLVLCLPIDFAFGCVTFRGLTQSLGNRDFDFAISHYQSQSHCFFYRLSIRRWYKLVKTNV